jgi:anti-anti-sigma factor
MDPGSRPAPPPGLHSAYHYVVDGWLVVELSGEIDSAAERTVERALAGELSPARPDVIVDLTPVTFLDSGGFRALVRARDRAAELGGSMRLVCPPGTVREHLRVLSGDRRLPALPDLGTALAAGAPPHGSPGTGNRR